jgi:hypothetical protein
VNELTMKKRIAELGQISSKLALGVRQPLGFFAAD